MMTKNEAILRIKEIQSGGGDPCRKFPEGLKGNLFKMLERKEYETLQYGMEYGEIHGLMKAFGITVEEVQNYHENLEKKKARHEAGDKNSLSVWNDLVECSKCKAQGHYTWTPIGDYVYPTTFTCSECGTRNEMGVNFVFNSKEAV